MDEEVSFEFQELFVFKIPLFVFSYKKKTQQNVCGGGL